MHYAFGSNGSQPVLPSLQLSHKTQNYRRKAPQNKDQYNLNPEKSHTQPKQSLLHDVSVPNLASPAARDLSLGLMKSILNQSYSKQIVQKANGQLLSKKLKIMEQKDYLSQFQKHKDFETRKKLQQKEQYCKQLLTDISDRQVIVDSVKTEEKELEKIFQEPRQRSLRHKSKAFEQFYEQAKKYQQQVATQYIEYMKVEKNFAKAKNKDKISNYQRNFGLANQHKQEESKLQNMRRENLKKTLESQIKVNEEKNRHRLPGRSGSMGLQERYNTILNPIDFKMDINNKYVLSQITRKI